MKIAIVGYGEQGRSAYEYWKNDHEITVCDSNEDLPLPSDVQAHLGPDHLSGLSAFDLVVRSPIVHPQKLVEANGVAILDKTTTNTNEFFKVCPTKNIIGVTGTKGKGTTSTLVAKILEADGKTVHLGGNIGLPPLDLLKNHIQPNDWVVLELANFQLIDLKKSPHIAVCLMVVPEHLDWHKDISEYYKSKTQLFRYQTPVDIAIYYATNENSKQIASHGSGHKVPYSARPGALILDNSIVIEGNHLCSVNDLRLLGRHNWQNVCAAVTAAWQVTRNVNAISDVVTSFTGLEHRLELVRDFNGVTYYDDSFGTTPDTAIVALEAFKQPKILILGGSDKGARYDALARAVCANHVRKVILIGEQANRIQAALEQSGFKDYASGGENMTSIIKVAREAAEPGDVVLLSTACASFDMFKNYKDRGNQFKSEVQALQ